MALKRPPRFQPASAGGLLIFCIAGTAIVWIYGSAIFGAILLVATPFVVANVLLGGGWNDSPLDLEERIKEVRKRGFEAIVSQEDE